MDNTNRPAQQVRGPSQFSDDNVEGCCLIFNRPRRRNAHRRPLFRPRARGPNSEKVLPKGDGRKSPEELAPKAVDPASALAPRNTESLQTTSPSNSADAETEESRRTINSAITALNKTITQFYDTLEEFVELGQVFDYDEVVRIRDVPLRAASLDEGIELVSSIIHDMIVKQEKANDAMSLELGALATIGRGLISICRSLKPALKNFLAVAVQSDALVEQDSNRIVGFANQLKDMKTHIERLELSHRIPENFGKMKAIVYANAFAVLEAVLDLLVELQYRTLSLSDVGRVAKSLVVDEQKRYDDAVEKLKNNIIKFNTSLNDTGLIVNIDTNITGRNTKALVEQLSSRQADERMEKVLEWLSPGNLSRTHEVLVKERVDNSGHWFLASQKFQHWASGEGYEFLFCPGRAGAGKSIMTSAAIDHLHGRPWQNKPVGVIYFYFKYNDRENQNGERVSASLLKQLVYQLGTLPAKLDKWYNEAKTGYPPNSKVIAELIVSCSQQFSLVFVFLDGLDECTDAQQNDVICLIRQLRDGGIRVFLTSRPDTEYRVKKLQPFELLPITADEKDIGIYLNLKLDVEPCLKTELKQAIKENLVRATDGMFLLLKLRLESILQFRDPRDKWAQLNALPKSLEEAYENMLTRIHERNGNDSSHAFKIFSWIFHARRPLLMSEIREVLSVRSYDREVNENNLIASKDIIACCHGMVVWEQSDDTVGFTHQTVRDFLEAKYLERLSLHEVVKTCLTYLSFDVFAEGPCPDIISLERRLKDHKFSRYASQFWGFHAQGEPENLGSVGIDIIKVLSSEKTKDSILQIESYCNSTWDNISFTKGQTLLHIISEQGLETVCRLILYGGKSQNNRDVHVATGQQIESSETSSHVLEVLSLVDWKELVKSRDENGETALHYAARNGHVGVVKVLLEGHAQVGIQNRKGETALTWAAKKGYLEVVILLVEEKAEVGTKNQFGETALALAVRNGHIKVVKKLLSANADVGARDKQGKTVLHHAAWNNNSDIVKVLLDAKADVTAQDAEGKTALHWAAKNENLQVVVELLNKNADGGKKDTCGWTPLHWAAWNEKAEIANALLDANVDVTSQDNDGKTALHWTASHGNSEVAKALLRKMPNSTILDKEGKAAIHWAASNVNVDVVNVFMDAETEDTTRDKEGMTILHWAVSNENLKVVSALLERKVNINEKDNNGWTPLHWAAWNRNTGITHALIEANADVMMQDEAGKTALHWAAQKGNVEIVKVLLARMPNKTVQDKNGKTALDWALQRNHIEVANVLHEKARSIK